MKSTLAKGALALSVLGFTFGSNVVYEQNSWKPSIFRTIANSIEIEALTEENVEAELKELQTLVASVIEKNDLIKSSLESKETGLASLIELRDEKIQEAANELDLIEKRKERYIEYFEGKEESQVKSDFESEFDKVQGLSLDSYSNQLKDKITAAQEAEILEQKAALAAANEKICENKGLLQDIKAQIAKLLEDKEEVVAAADAEDDSREETEDGFSADVVTYADFFAHIQEQQRSFFEMSTPSFLAPAQNPFSMLMMMSMMNSRQFSAPKTQVNTYYMSPSFSQFELPGMDSRRNPANLVPSKSLNQEAPAYFHMIDGHRYLRDFDSVSRGNGLLDTISIN